PAGGALTARVRLGASWPRVLRRAGQPAKRGARAWRWCVAGGGADVAVFGRRGRVALVGSTAPGRTAGARRDAAAASGGPRSARELAVGARVRGGSGLRVRGRAVVDVRGGRVRAVAVARP